MEINITRFVLSECLRDYSDSVAELGNGAGADTWRAACDNAPDYSDWLDTDDKRESFRDFVRGYGAWSDNEINAWSNDELTALLIQFISGDIRESWGGELANTWPEYYELVEQCVVSGSLFADDEGLIYWTGE